MNEQGEIIQVHVGQAGAQIGNACWELFCLEHKLNPCDTTKNTEFSSNSLFSILPDGKVIPRTIMVDSDPAVIDQIRIGPFRHLFHPSSMISGKNDSGNNFARGYYQINNEINDIIMDSIRSSAEGCANLQGFIIFRSIGGGTGSGLGTRIFENIRTDYPNLTNIEFVIFPSEVASSVIVEPINAVLSAHLGIESSDCSFLIDNSAVNNICTTKLDLVCPTFNNYNRLIAQVISSYTSPFRYNCLKDYTLNELKNILVPYSRIRYPTMSYSPMLPTASRKRRGRLSMQGMTYSIFDPSNHLNKSNPDTGHFLSCVLLYRGDISSLDINYAIYNAKLEQNNFIEWTPTDIKTFNTSISPITLPDGDIYPRKMDLSMFSNNSCVKNSWSELLENFKTMYAKKSFIYHYIGEGLEEATLQEAVENLSALLDGYNEIEIVNKENV